MNNLTHFESEAHSLSYEDSECNELLNDDLARFVETLAPTGVLTFQTLAEGLVDASTPKYSLNKILHGSLFEHQSTLERLNARGAAVFLMVNEGDGYERTANCVQSVRALFVDLDGAPIEPVLECPLRPSIVVESSKDRFHAYWLVENVPLNAFREAQKALAERFNGDRVVCDLSRIMRVPGLWHRKKVPSFRSRLLECDSARKCQQNIWPSS